MKKLKIIIPIIICAIIVSLFYVLRQILCFDKTLVFYEEDTEAIAAITQGQRKYELYSESMNEKNSSVQASSTEAFSAELLADFENTTPVNTEIKFTVTTSDDTETQYTYKYSVYYFDDDSFTLLQDSNTKAICKYTPTMAGLYTVYVDITNAEGICVTKSFPFRVLPSVKKGIDVSEHQYEIDWEKAAAQIDFAMIRVGYGQEDGQEDKFFAANYEQAKKNGVKIGIYHYSYAMTEKDAKKEAEYCLSLLDSCSIDLPLVYDVEEEKHKSLTKKQLTDNIITFCETVKEAGYTPMVYSNLTILRYSIDWERIKNYGIWLAYYPSADGVTHTITEESIYPYMYPVNIWQYSCTGNGETYGVSSKDVDLNFMYDGISSTGLNLPGPKGMCTKDNVLVRSAPQQFTDTVIGKLYQGNQFTILYEKGRWAYVYFGYGETGWVYRDQIQVIE